MAAFAAGAMVMLAVLAGCSPGTEKLRAQLDPVVAKITDRARAAAALTGGQSAATIARTTELQTDLAGLGADLKSLYVEGEKQQALVVSGQAYLSATQRFVTAQQEFARGYARLEAARAKVRESLDARARTSKFSMDFWKETHDRLVVTLDTVRKEVEKARDRLAAATSSMEQAAEAAGSALGRESVLAKGALDAHRKALDGVPLAKGA